MAALDVDWAQSIFGKRSIRPTAFKSRQPFQIPLKILPSPLGTTTRSGTSPPRSSQISKAQVFLPSRVNGLKRVFNIDIEICNKCGGDVKIIASIEDPVVIQKILSFYYSTGARFHDEFAQALA
jgi:hypothetical protein